MTSYSSMAARGREEARARTAGRRKPVVARLDYSKTPDPDMPSGRFDLIDVVLIGKCGHVLERKRWRTFAGPEDPKDWKLTAMRRKVGRRMTCQHDDCRIATATGTNRPTEER